MRNVSALRSRNGNPLPSEARRGAILILTAILMVVIFAFVAFTVDLGYLAVMKTDLQMAADSAALASVRDLGIGEAAARSTAKQLASKNRVAGDAVSLEDTDIEIGIFDEATRSFRVSSVGANSVRVTARRLDHPTFFAPVIGHHQMSAQAQATAMMSPRDIVFVVDLSGSMNDDTEPCWATTVIDAEMAGEGYANAGTNLVKDLFSDFGFGAFPGTIEYIGRPLGTPQNSYAYAELTKDDGPLTGSSIPKSYRIKNNDNESTRKRKAYSWMIDYQIAKVMPAALPPADSSKHYSYWEKYLDYIIQGRSVGKNPPKPPKPPGNGGGGGGGGGGGSTPKPPPPPKPPIGNYLPGRHSLDGLASEFWAGIGQSAEGVQFDWRTGQLTINTLAANDPIGTPRRGSTLKVYLPPSHDGDRIDDFNNPNSYTFPSAKSSLPRSWRNQIGYVTYAQFMLDWGRDRSPEEANWKNARKNIPGKTPLSVDSPFCPYHKEATAGGTFSFPPRTQPMHAVRRSLIAAIQVVKELNSGLTMGAGDRVSIVSYDGLDADHKPELVLELTGDYDAAMLACTKLQATSDLGRTTAMESGLILARDHLRIEKEGGKGRQFTTKVVVLLTDGVPNEWESDASEIQDYITENPDGDYYGSDYAWYNSVLMQTSQFQADAADSRLFPVGMGLGTDYDFMDRVARMAQTDRNGESARGSGNPTEYEQRLTEIFEEILKRPNSRLVD